MIAVGLGLSKRLPKSRGPGGGNEEDWGKDKFPIDDKPRMRKMHQLTQQRGRCQTSVPSPGNSMCKVRATAVGLPVTWCSWKTPCKQGSGAASREKEASSTLFGAPSPCSTFHQKSQEMHARESAIKAREAGPGLGAELLAGPVQTTWRRAVLLLTLELSTTALQLFVCFRGKA